jgi:hypothetical protein
MAGYTFYFLRSDRGVPAFDFADCCSDGEAMVLAKRYLTIHPTAERVETFNGERIIGCVERSETRVRRALRSMTSRGAAEMRCEKLEP